MDLRYEENRCGFHLFCYRLYPLAVFLFSKNYVFVAQIWQRVTKYRTDVLR